MTPGWDEALTAMADLGLADTNPHRCAWCGLTDPRWKMVRVESAVTDGDTMMHRDCLEEHLRTLTPDCAIFDALDRRVTRLVQVTPTYVARLEREEAEPKRDWVPDRRARRQLEPSAERLTQMILTGDHRTPCGCRVSSRGECDHGKRSWCVVLGLLPE